MPGATLVSQDIIGSVDVTANQSATAFAFAEGGQRRCSCHG
jgi:hypothetical protein